jgi:putative hemolysin
MNVHTDGIHLPGVLPVEKLPELGIELPAGNYATVAGAVLDRLGRIPETPGDTVRIAGWEIEVVDVQGRAISGVLIRPLATSGVDR